MNSSIDPFRTIFEKKFTIELYALPAYVNITGSELTKGNSGSAESKLFCITDPPFL